MDLNKFGYVRNLKRLEDKFNQHAAKDDWKQPACIKVERTYFASNHAVGYGLNGNSNLVELQTDLVELREVRIKRWIKSSKPYITLYGKSSANTYRGEHLSDLTLLEFKKGKETVTVHVPDRGEIDSNYMYRLERLFKLDSEGQPMKREKLESLIKYNFSYGEVEQALLDANRIQLLDKFKFNYMVRISVSGFNETSRSLEIATYSNGTYCSLPETFKLTMARGIKTQRLADIGVETSGYYDHHVKLEIKPEQIEQAKALASKVKRLSKSA